MKITRFITASALFLMALVSAVPAQTVEVPNSMALSMVCRQAPRAGCQI